MVNSVRFLHPRSSLSERWDDTQDYVWNGKARAYGVTLIDSHGFKQRFPPKKNQTHDLVTSESLGIFLPVVLKSWKTSVVTCWQRCQLKSGPSWLLILEDGSSCLRRWRLTVVGSTWEISWESQVLSSFIAWLQGTTDLAIYGAMSWKSTVVGGKYFEGYWLRSQEWDFCTHAWSNLTSRWAKSSVSGGVQNAQSVGALLSHHSAQSYGSGLAQEKEALCSGLWPQCGHDLSSSTWRCNCGGWASSRAGAWRSQSVRKITNLPLFQHLGSLWHPKNWSVSSF